MQSNLEGRLKNFKFEKRDSNYAIFESIVNALQSYPTDSVKVAKVEVIRDDALSANKEDLTDKEISSIIISDSGKGFTDENFKAFKTLDETTKPKLGCKGIGRLAWLKVFQLATVKSVFVKNHDKYQRTFRFSANKEVFDEQLEKVDEALPTGTVIALSMRQRGFLEGVQYSPERLKTAILSHCVKYLLNEKEKTDIQITDNGETTSLAEELKKLQEQAIGPVTFKINGFDFSVSHLLLKDLKSPSRLAWCANGRVVIDDEKSFKEIPEASFSLSNSDRPLTYICLIESPYLDKTVNPDRTGFMIPQEKGELDDEDTLDFSIMKKEVSSQVENFLQPFIEEERQARVNTLEKFEQDNPTFKHVLDVCKDEIQINSRASDAEIRKAVRKKEAEIKDQLEEDLNAVKKDLNNPVLEKVEEAVDRYYKIIMSSKSIAVGRTALTEYVVRRKAILKCFEKALEIGDNGKYQKEDFIHNLIIPMHCDSSTMYFDEANLWVIDDRLAFHNYLASDIKLKQFKISELDDDKRPDIATLSLCNYSGAMGVGDDPAGRIEIVEFKRPMRDNIKEAFQQVLDYAIKLHDSKINSYKGRQLNCLGPIFGYIVCDINKDFENYLINREEFKKVDTGFLYKAHKTEQFSLVVEVLSYDYLLKRAEQRNQAFFKLLGIAS